MNEEPRLLSIVCLSPVAVEVYANPLPMSRSPETRPHLKMIAPGVSLFPTNLNLARSVTGPWSSNDL